MGEVYGATDTNLGRKVAIKVLPADVASDPGRLARFDREARTLAALNHPNIAAIYGVERSQTTTALVMELVEGTTLADRIAKGPIPFEEAISSAVQIAEALEAAHEQGIIHRDLKPANVKVRPDGAVKVLDFGLAKALEPTADSSGRSQSPTITSSAMTQDGVVLGTAAYMSPEQARGQPTDKRSDVWAFGCLLFEMLTGKRAFSGSSVSDTIASVLRAEPDWTALPPSVPPSIRTLLRRCLEKDRRRRLRDIGDARLELDEEVIPSPPGGPSPDRLRWREATAWTFGVVALLGVVALWMLRTDRASTSAPTYRTSVLPPPVMTFSPHDFAISPDGRRIAFVTIAPDGATTLWVRSLDARSAQPVTDTSGASYPFWAPDSRRVGFFAGGHLRTVDTATGATLTLAEAPAGRGGAWSTEGVIVYALSVAGPLLSVPERGGPTRPVTRVIPESKAHRWPWLLPDQKHFLFLEEWGVASDPRPSGIYVGSLDGGESTLVSADIRGNVAFANGYLLYVQNASLMGQPFDDAQLRLTGPAVSILDQELGTDQAFGHGTFSVSSNGVVLFQSNADSAKELIWYGADGASLGRIPVSTAGSVDISPTGQSVAYSSEDAAGKRYVRTWDLKREISTKLTDSGRENWPIWSNDEKRLVYQAHEGGETYTVNEIPAYGTGPRELLRGARMGATGYSPDGRSLLLMTFERGAPNLAVYDTRERRSTIWHRGAEGQYSPDGKWIAWVILGDIFVQPVSGEGSRVLVSRAGGGQPRWSGDGRRLFYLAPDRKMMEVTIDVRDGELAAGSPRALFQTRVLTPWFGYFQYDLTPDASRFLVNSLKAEAPLTLVTGWPVLLRR